MKAHHQNDLESVATAVMTVSDSRTENDDHSGDEAVRLLVAAGHRVLHRCIVPDDEAPLRSQLVAWIEQPEVEAIVLTGGTGISPRDRTPDVVNQLLEVELPGFGEHFRAISHHEIGPKAMLSRAIAGRVGRCLMFALPGSTSAVRTGMERCVLPILPHAVALARG